MAVEGSALERGKPDPNVVLPPAVRRAAERSEELAKQAKEARDANPNANDPVKVDVSGMRPNGGNVVAISTDFDPNNPNPPGSDQLSIVNTTAPNTPGQTPQPQYGQQPADLEHQLRSLQGRYSKTDEENRRMAQQVSDLNRLLASVQTAPPPQEGQGGGQGNGSGVKFPTPNGQRRISQKEEEEFGKEFIDVVGRRAMEVQEATLHPVLSQLEQKIRALEGQLGGVRQVQHTDAQERIWQILDRDIPNWQQINSSQEFVRWLQIPDALSGVRRYDMLDEAFKTQQVGRVEAFFRSFLTEYSPQPGYTNGGRPSNQQVDLMSLAAPGRAKAGQTSVTNEKPTYSVSDIKQFYHDKTFGKYKGREADMQAIENDIFAAQRDGRIRQ